MQTGIGLVPLPEPRKPKVVFAPAAKRAVVGGVAGGHRRPLLATVAFHAELTCWPPA